MYTAKYFAFACLALSVYATVYNIEHYWREAALLKINQFSVYSCRYVCRLGVGKSIVRFIRLISVVCSVKSATKLSSQKSQKFSTLILRAQNCAANSLQFVVL